MAHEFLGHPDHNLAGRDVTDLGESIRVQFEALDYVLACIGVPQRRRVARGGVFSEKS
jgi:hypothetical protein